MMFLIFSRVRAEVEVQLLNPGATKTTIYQLFGKSKSISKT